MRKSGNHGRLGACARAAGLVKRYAVMNGRGKVGKAHATERAAKAAAKAYTAKTGTRAIVFPVVTR